MRYDDSAERAAYLAGASAAVEAVILSVSGPEARELEAWLDELSGWTGGEPPQSPQCWGSDTGEGE
jgi:hypothetical protein